MKIVWTQKATDQLSEIHKFIKDDSPLSAQKWVAALFEKVSKLEGFPKIGRKLPELKIENLREIIFGNYRIIYLIRREAIHIMAIRHFKQKLPAGDLSE